MKKTHFKIGLLTACLIGVSTVASAQSCGAKSCGSGACKCSKKHCDDKGLLEVINNTASNFEAKLASLIPDLDKPVVQAKSTCVCPNCAKAAASHQSQPKNSVHKVPHHPSPVAQPDHAHPPLPRVAPLPNPIGDPVSVPAPPENVPLPDARVNPFKDDSTSRNLRQVPARPVKYLPSSRHIEVEYDPQANNQPALRSVLVSKAASKTMSDSLNGLATSASTRRVQTALQDASKQTEDSFFEQTPPEVVPASINVPANRSRPLSTMPPASDQFTNPLRAH
jgi:hypothetical protein